MSAEIKIIERPECLSYKYNPELSTELILENDVIKVEPPDEEFSEIPEEIEVELFEVKVEFEDYQNSK